MKYLILFFLFTVISIAQVADPPAESDPDWDKTQIDSCISNTPLRLFNGAITIKGMSIKGVRIINQSTFDKISLRDPDKRNDAKIKAEENVNILSKELE